MSEETTTPRPDAVLGKDAPEPGQRFKGKRRRKVSYLTINKIDTVDYKEVNILRRFLNDRGKILPSRQSGNTAKQQRMISQAIRRAREMALLPFVVTEASPDRREYVRRPRRDDGYRRDEEQQQQQPQAQQEQTQE
jgi:small subunit ribosomal protein S18